MKGFVTGHLDWGFVSDPELPGNPKLLSIRTEVTSYQEPMCSEVTASKTQPGLVFNLLPSIAESQGYPISSMLPVAMELRPTDRLINTTSIQHPAENPGHGRV